MIANNLWAGEALRPSLSIADLKPRGVMMQVLQAIATAPMSQKEICDWLDLSSTAVSRAILALQIGGLVERRYRYHPGDRTGDAVTYWDTTDRVKRGDEQ